MSELLDGIFRCLMKFDTRCRDYTIVMCCERRDVVSVYCSNSLMKLDDRKATLSIKHLKHNIVRGSNGDRSFAAAGWHTWNDPNCLTYGKTSAYMAAENIYDWELTNHSTSQLLAYLHHRNTVIYLLTHWSELTSFC